MHGETVPEIGSAVSVFSSVALCSDSQYLLNILTNRQLLHSPGYEAVL